MSSTDGQDNTPGFGGSFDAYGTSGATGGDTFSETTSTSWFERIGNSLKSLLLAPIVVLVGIVVLGWNEGRAVGTARSLTEGAGVVVSVEASPIQSGNEGKLVHVMGPLTVTGKLQDTGFGVSAEGLRLVRKVEAFQWKETSHSETRKKLGGGEETITTYTYSTEWTDTPVDGSSFKQPNGHRNPPVPVASQTFTAPKVQLGDFTLTSGQAGSLGKTQARPVQPAELAAVRAAAGNGQAQILDGRVYVGADPARPKVGDFRISYEVAPAGEATVVARQSGKGFSAYTTSNGRSIEILHDGQVPAAQVFKEAQQENSILTWILRLVGMVVLFIGFSMLVGPLSVIADVVPFIGSIIGGIGSFFAFGAALFVGSITIAIAWFAVRPLMSIGLIVAGVAAVVLFRKLAGSRRPAAGPASVKA
jgi:hypothetical protein